MKKAIILAALLLASLPLQKINTMADETAQADYCNLCVYDGTEQLPDIWPEFSAQSGGELLEFQVTVENRDYNADYLNLFLQAVPKETALESIKQLFDMPYRDRLEQVNELQLKAEMEKDSELSAYYYETWYEIIQKSDPLTILYGAGEPLYEEAADLVRFLESCKARVYGLSEEASLSKAGEVGAPLKKSCGRINLGETKEIKIVLELPNQVRPEDRLLMQQIQWNLCAEERYEHPAFDIDISVVNPPENNEYYQEGEEIRLDVVLENRGNGRLTRIVYHTRGFEGEEYGARGVYDTEVGTKGTDRYPVTAEEAERGEFVVKMRCWAKFDNPDLDFIYVEKEIHLPAGKKQSQGLMEAGETNPTETETKSGETNPTPAETLSGGELDKTTGRWEAPAFIGTGILIVGGIVTGIFYRQKKERLCEEKELNA